jgi:hypothetical protein
MRETRSSGSVEGVMGDHDSYSDLVNRPSTLVKCFLFWNSNPTLSHSAVYPAI